MKKAALLTLVLLVFGTQPAFAYIDPGSGSALMSVIVGFFVAAGMLIKTFWYKIKAFLGFSKSEDSTAKSDQDTQDHK